MNSSHLSKILIGLVLILTSCKEFIEPSVENRKVVLLAPSNGTETNDYTQIFWWEKVEDALSYRLQVVSSDFNHIQKLVLDTLIKGSTKFKSSLDPGKYEWRVKAQNGSSSTAYTTAAFTIYSTSITEQQVQLDGPANNTITNQANVSLKWLKLFGADSYRIQIDDSGGGFQDNTTLFVDKTTSNLQYPVTFTQDKVCQWRVRALSGTSVSKWSVIQNISFDSTPPPVVQLSSPVNNTVVPSPVTLTWIAPGDAKKYMLYVYKSDSTQLYNGTFPVTTTRLSYVFTSTIPSEKVFWEVRAIDEPAIQVQRAN